MTSTATITEPVPAIGCGKTFRVGEAVQPLLAPEIEGQSLLVESMSPKVLRDAGTADSAVKLAKPESHSYSQ